jgi:hypothetical protein
VDGDGLNDAWEIAGGIDLNGDGKIDAQHDLLLPGADPNKPDIYVHYDWMDYGTLEYACVADSECPQNGSSQFGTATCSGPPIPGSAKSCVQACTTDADCQALGGAEVADHCVSNVCEHTHDPELITPGAIRAVVDSFAAHGINLHIERGQALPHSHVISFRTLGEMTDACEGGSLVSGTAGSGKYTESFFDLKGKHFNPKEGPAYHYTVLSHYSGCDSIAHCAADAHTGACPLGITGCRTAKLGQSGYSEINGNNFIVSLGNFINDKEAFLTTPAPGGAPFGQFIFGGTFMHELGHNLGLRHGGGMSATHDPNTCTPPVCEDECTMPGEPNFKPNYLSVMNYRYQFSGIQSASAPGGFVPADTRLDYSTQVLPTVPISDSVPGVLDEAGLDETVPFGLTSGNSDLFTFADGACIRHPAWPTQGPVDWDGNHIFGDNSSAMADLDPESDGDVCGQPTALHRGHVDWGPAPGQSIFRYGFQCAPSSDNPLGSTLPVAIAELSADEARRAHVLYPTRAVQIIVQPGCAAKAIAPGQRGTATVALLGARDFDVSKVDTESLHFHGARPLRTVVRDVNGDGFPDLVIELSLADIRLRPEAKKARLEGWLKSSQRFIGEDSVAVVPNTESLALACKSGGKL